MKPDYIGINYVMDVFLHVYPDVMCGIQCGIRRIYCRIHTAEEGAETG